MNYKLETIKNRRYKTTCDSPVVSSYSIKTLVLVVVFMITFAGFFNVNETGSSRVYATTTTVNNATGYVNANGGVNLRSSSSTLSKKVCLLKDNTKVTIYKRIYKSKTSTKASKIWYYVKAGDKKGYVRSDYVDNVKYSAVNGKLLNKATFRAGAGTKMASKGTIAKGKTVTVYLKATPVSSTKGSSSVWYRIKYDGKIGYICSTNITITGSIFVDPGKSDSSSTSTNTGTGTSANKFEKMTDAEFTQYLKDQGFTESYRTKLLALHKKHPNWVFKAKITGISWDSAVAKESANGVSLIEGSQPVSYRATDSNSFKASSTNIYKTASTSTKVGTVGNKTSFTLLDEVWKGTSCWMHIKTSGGTIGYVQKNPYSQTFDETITGSITADGVNMRKGAGTSNSVKKSLSKGTTVQIVLQCKDSDGKVWYKVKNGSGYGYVSGSYVKAGSNIDTKVTTTTTTLSSSYAKAKAIASVEYRATPDNSYPSIGKFSKDTEVTVIAQVEKNSITWYQIYKGGNIVYAPSKSFTVTYVPSASVDSASLNQTSDEGDAKMADTTEKAEIDTESASTDDNSNPVVEVTDPAQSDNDEVKTENTASPDAVSSENELEEEAVETASLCAAEPDIQIGIVQALTGTTNTAVNYRKGAGTSYDRVGTLDSGTKITITGNKLNGSTLWYSFKKNSNTYYVCAEYVNLILADAPSDAAPTVKTTTTVKSVSGKPSDLKGKATVLSGTYIAKDGSNWFNASSKVVGYYMDPRNFINEDRIYMFEDLSYQSEYQTTTVVSKVLAGSKLPGYGFTAKIFVNAGSKYKISPVFLAARARQETGGGSVAINGTSYNGTVVYNPFNIGATSSANPVWNGMKYAYNHGWTTQTKAVNGGADFMASGYVNAGQNSNYYQRFNVANGLSKVATHQYMTNVQAPYHESYSSGSSYKSYGITGQPLTFIIPVFNNMPTSTSLPN